MKTVSYKRILLHVAFWLAYLAQDITLIYLWDKDKHPGVSISRQLMFAFLNSASSLIPKLLFCYYVLYYNLPKLLNSKKDRNKIHCPAPVGASFDHDVVPGNGHILSKSGDL